MGKRSTGVSVTKVYKHPHKTAKRLEIKHAMLDARTAKKAPKGAAVKN